MRIFPYINKEFIAMILLTIAGYWIYATSIVSDPTMHIIQVPWYYGFGKFLSTLYASKVVCAFLVMIFLNGFYRIVKPDTCIIETPKEKILKLEDILKNKNMQLRYSKSEISRLMNKTISLIAIINLVEKGSCPNCLANLESWPEMEALV